MKKLVVKLTPFVLLFILANYWVLSSNGFYKKGKAYDRAIQETANTEHFFLGDSHVDVLKNLDLEDNVSNLAFGGDGIQEMYLKTRILLEENSHIKTVFVLTDPQLFNSSISPNKTFLANYVLKLGEEEVYGKNTLSYLIEQAPLLNDGFIEYSRDKYIYRFLKLISKKKVNNKQKVMWKDLPQKQRDFQCIETGIQDHKGIFSSSDSKKYFSKMVALCKEKNVKIIGVRFPVERLFYQQCNSKDLQLVDDYIDSLKLDQHLDYSLYFNSSQYFKDEDHLTIPGAIKIVEEISKQTGITILKK